MTDPQGAPAGEAALDALRPPALVTDVAARVAAEGGRALLVGGSLRDHLLGRPIKDWDVEVHGLDADALERALRRAGRVGTVGKAFQVFKVRRGNLEIDVSLPRRDAKEGPGHRGIRAVADPSLDVAEAARRRDLTINAIMVDLSTGDVLDPFRGIDDLRAGVLRPVDEGTFLEDPLRALRVLQFAARFGFTATPALRALCAAAPLDELPPERVQGEWLKLLLRGVAIADGLRLAREVGVTSRVFPGVRDEEVGDALDRARPARDAEADEGRAIALMLTIWLHASPPEAVLAALDRLALFTWSRYPARDAVLAACAAWTAPYASDRDLRWMSTRAEVQLVLLARGAAGEPTAGALARAEALGVSTAAPAPLALGRDLIALGARPGPALGRALASAYHRQLDGDLTTRDDAIAAARAALDEVTRTA